MDTIHIAIVPGDGIGPEVCASAVRVLQQVAGPIVNLSLKEYPGGAGCYLKTGKAFPDVTKKACIAADAILHGAVGLSDVVYPDGTEVGQDFSMQARELLDLYANIRPVKTYQGLTPVLARDRQIDYVIVRENTEGLYAARGGGNIVRDQVASDTLVMTRMGIERIVHKAAEVAMSRDGAPSDGKRRVTIVDKANVLRSYAFFRRVALEVLENYPEIEVECTIVDAMTAHLVQRPDHFDVVVTENIFGDILSDLGAATVGGLGIAPSAEIGTDHGYFQGIHGSAPDIAGAGVANPTATILSVGMMLDWLGMRRQNTELRQAGRDILYVISTMFSDGASLTRDLGGTASTVDFTNMVLAKLEKVPA